MPSDDPNDNAGAFIAAFDSIRTTDVSASRTNTFTSEDDFNGLSVELLIEVGSFICVAANLLPHGGRWSRNEAVLGGHVVRLYKLISALLDQICQRRREITFIIGRLTFECIVNLRFLLKHADDPTVFHSYVAYSMRNERRLQDKIEERIAAREGKILPVETRMLNSIAKVANASGVCIEDASASRPKEWADKNIFERAEAVGLGESYLGAFRGPSASVHGNWMDLLEFQLDTHHDEGTFAPSFEWRNPRPQIAQTIAHLATEAVRDYFRHLGEGPLEFIDERFDELSSRILEAMKAHEAYLVRSDAL
ncbi:DUF5677 domain-containing protein [Bradyrhizobium barranii subsp. apii]|uniref:DUF5677 domain-containing protein n=1 Tax=Bradyrhizobium barranii TaxID=2992140 RepID=UPI001AA0D797|nr:DUF5677 domain-containing protein [Bradyrhizobium barranii]UPT95115.1 DUF5677 domain-containing protein [Bradyrhizobium barranii subsp. apii]